ncbi:MAG: hypothetical protein KAX05_13825 [Bacteroidales bacterium]|nr:hypothetical protein [Bacteroidales bacterium]
MKSRPVCGTERKLRAGNRPVISADPAGEGREPSDRPPARPTGVIRAGMKEFILSGRL